MKIFSSGAGLAVIPLVLLVLAALAAGMYYIFIPAWNVFLDLEGFWLPLLCITGGGIVLSLVNVPLPIKINGIRYAFNLFGFATPPVLIWWVGTEIDLTFDGLLLVPIALSLVLYFILTRVERDGVKIPLLLIWGLSIVDVLFIHYACTYELRTVMWWAYTMQFGTLLVVDLFKGFTGNFGYDVEMLSIGGAGASDALWAAPVSALSMAFVAQWLLWDGVEKYLTY